MGTYRARSTAIGRAISRRVLLDGALGRRLNGVGRLQRFDLIGQFVGRWVRLGAFLDRLVDRRLVDRL